MYNRQGLWNQDWVRYTFFFCYSYWWYSNGPCGFDGKHTHRAGGVCFAIMSMRVTNVLETFYKNKLYIYTYSLEGMYVYSVRHNKFFLID